VGNAGPRDATIVVTGATGQIGYEAVRQLAPHGKVVGLTRGDLDLSDPAAIREAMRRLRPRVIVNAAAYTAVDLAETERGFATAINAVAPGILAEEARRLGAVLVHFSTDYVFDGRKGSPYVETDRPNPLSVYGATKLAGEQAIQGVGGTHVILRTSWVYGARGTNFVRTIMRLAREREELRVVNDQIGAPTWSRTIASIIGDILGHELERGSELSAGLSGLYHLSAAGETSWFDFARCILEKDPRRQEQKCQRITPVSSDEFAAAAKKPVARRPAYSVLDNAAFATRFRRSLADWRQPLDSVLAQMREDAANAGLGGAPSPD
jgi:dTDP-4-dehydrorhamnose reductase